MQAAATSPADASSGSSCLLDIYSFAVISVVGRDLRTAPARPPTRGRHATARIPAAGIAHQPGRRFALGLQAVPYTESALYVPLRSNANSLVTGTPIAALRRRLKYASVFHDTLILESGILRRHADAGGSFSSVDPPTRSCGTPVSGL